MSVGSMWPQLRSTRRTWCFITGVSAKAGMPVTNGSARSPKWAKASVGMASPRTSAPSTISRARAASTLAYEMRGRPGNRTSSSGSR